MKKFRFTLLATVSLLLMVSCNQDSENLSIPNSYGNNLTRSENNISDVDFSALDTTYFVTDKDLMAYIHYKELLAEGAKQVFSVKNVEPLSLENGTILGYLLNFNEGWEIIAADKRAPTVLASDNKGNFVQSEVPDNMLEWISTLLYDVLSVRAMKEEPEDESVKENMQYSVTFWKAITADKEFVEQTHTRSEIILPPEEDITTYWRVVSIDSVLYDDGDTYLTNTSWGQDEYSIVPSKRYNLYCPFRTDETSLHAPAGCVALSGAQMLYYLHYALGVPEYAPDYAECTGNINCYYRLINGESNTIWDYMVNNDGNDVSSGYEAAAILIAYVGKLVGVTYGNDGSPAQTEDLVDDVFEHLGISSTYGDYSPTTVLQSLRNRMPVVASARTITGHFLFFNITAGHSFIIDKYRSHHYKLTYHYVLVEVDGYGHVTETNQTRTSISYTSPIITTIGMNWGWKGSYNYSMFAPSGDWYVGTSNFNRSRNIIYGFSASN